jgi:hypothetical protein
MLRNIGERWNIHRGQGNKDLEAMMTEIETKHAKDMPMLYKELPYRFVIGALEDRSKAGRMTGDWIIFAKHKSQNYYLGLATHEEAEDGFALFERIKEGSKFEFPFLFADRDTE